MENRAVPGRLEDKLIAKLESEPMKALAYALMEILPSEWVFETAKETGFCQRTTSTFNPLVFLWHLVLPFGASLRMNLREYHRTHQKISAKTFSWPAYYKRFTPELAEFLSRAISRAISVVMGSQKRNLADFLEKIGIEDIIAIDSTLVPLNEELAELYPNARSATCSAAAKINVQLSLRNRSVRGFQIEKGKANESTLLEIEPWMKDHLLLFDMGYFKIDRFSEIENAGGYFITRLKSNVNPVLLRSYSSGRGNGINLKHCRLRTVEPYIKRKVLDAEAVFLPAKMSKKHKELLNSNPKELNPFRVVGIMNDETGEYHMYLTNLPYNRISPEQVAELYRVRWSVEILFKELKSYHGLSCIVTKKKSVMECLIYASILTLLVSRLVRNELENHAPEEEAKSVKAMGPLIYAEHFKFIAPSLVQLVLHHQGFFVDYMDNLLKFSFAGEEYPWRKDHKLPLEKVYLKESL